MCRASGLGPAMLALGFTVVASSCGGAIPPDHPRAQRVEEVGEFSGAPFKLDMDAIFPRGAGRDLMLDNCTNCHSFVRIVLMQRTREQWAVVKKAMRPRVVGLSDRDVDVIFDYLEASFSDTRPAPTLPKWFLDDAAW